MGKHSGLSCHSWVIKKDLRKQGLASDLKKSKECSTCFNKDSSADKCNLHRNERANRVDYIANTGHLGPDIARIPAPEVFRDKEKLEEFFKEQSQRR